MVDKRRVEFLSEDGNGCDLFDGDRVWNEKYSLYKYVDCKFFFFFHMKDFGVLKMGGPIIS